MFAKFISKFSSPFFHIRFEENGTKISVSTIQCQAAEELHHGREVFVWPIYIVATYNGLIPLNTWHTKFLAF